MKIDAAEVFHVRMPLIYPWRTAYGEDANIESVLVKLVGADGDYGWGETTPLAAPFYSPEWAGGVYRLVCGHLAPRIVGEDIRDAVDLLGRIAAFKGNGFAKAGLEVAWWVLEAKARRKPLHEVLGGRKTEVAVGADFGVQDSIDLLLTKIQGAIDQGYPRVKLKFRRGWDLEVLDRVRDAFPSHTFHIDCNAGFNLSDIELFKKVDRYELAMIEQPLDHADLLDHAELQRHLETPICLDESITTPKAMADAIKLGSCRYVNIKPGRVGGLTNAVRIHDLCEEAGVPCWVGGMLESGVGAGITIELATLSNFKYPADIFPIGVLYSVDLARPEIRLSSPGKIKTSEVPGTPYEPDPEMLRRCTLAHSSIGERIS